METASTCIETICPPNPGLDRSCAQPAQPGAACRLGQLLIARGDISVEQLSLALESQQRSGRKLGEELISAGFLSGSQVDFVLRIQERLAAVAALSDVL